MAATLALLLLACLAMAARGGDAGWFDADANLVTTPVVDALEAANDTAAYGDEDYGDDVTVEPSPARNASASVSRNASEATTEASPEARRGKAASVSGKTEEVNYWQTDGSSRTSASEEAGDEPQVSVKEHDRSPHPFAFSPSDANEWFGFDSGSSAEAAASKSRLGGSASVAVEDYQAKEQGGSREAAVEIKEHDEVGPGAAGGGASADGQWFGDFGGSQPDASASKAGARPSPTAGDDVWFGVEASEWQPVAASSHRQQRRLNWGEYGDGDDETPDIITAPPDAGRDVYSFVVESSFGGGKGSGKKDTDGGDEVEIVTAAPDAELGWFGAALEDAPPPARKVVKSRTSTTTVRATVIGRSRARVGVSRNHSFADLLARKSGGGRAASADQPPGVAANRASDPGAAGRQNASVAPPVDAGEEGNSVKFSPKSESVATALPTTTTTLAATTTTTAATTTTSAATTTTSAPEVPKSSPRTSTSIPDVTDANATRALAPKPVEVRKPVAEGAEIGDEAWATPSTRTMAPTVLPTRSGRTFAGTAPHPKSSQGSREEVPGHGAPANFSVASAASGSRTVVLRGDDANGRLQAGGAPASDNLSYILVGVCCAVSLVCLVVVVAVLRRRKSLRRRRRAPLQPGQLYAPTSYSYPPSARAGHPKDGGAMAPPDAKARMWFMGRKQSPYSLCDQHLSYCSRGAAADYKPAEGARRHSDGGALAKAPVYRTGFSGLSDARHSSGLDYMNKGEMIYWSSNNEQLI